MSDRYYPLSEPSVQASLGKVGAYGHYSGKLCACIFLLAGALLVPVRLHHRALQNSATAPAIYMPWHLSPPSLGPMMHWVPDPEEPQRLQSRSLYDDLFGLHQLPGSVHDAVSQLRYPFKKSQSGSQKDSQDFWQAERQRIEAAIPELEAKKKAAIEAERFDVAHTLKQEELSLKAQLAEVTSMQKDVALKQEEHSLKAQLAQAERREQADPFKELRAAGDLPGANVGQYSAHSFAMKSHAGPDGKAVTERYAASAVGDGSRGIHEARHMYSDSSGLGKSSHEQHLGERSRMTVDETLGNKSTSSQVFRGMDEKDEQAFAQDFDTDVKHLPHRAELGQKDLEPPSTKEVHNAAGYHTLAGWLDHDDFWESPHYEAALSPYDADEEPHWGTHHNFFLQPLRHGSRYMIPIA